MPINNITQTISTIPPAGARGVDVQTQFVIKQEDFQDHLQGTTVTELNTLKDQLNSRIGEINSTTTTMNGYASTASAGASTATTKAGEASTSASEALTSRNQAETFKNNANTSASTATTKASEASASALSANTSASTATTKASEASASALSANTSASTATTKASEASASALSANTSASTATTKASEASASATSASASASTATTSRNQAETFAQQAQASAASVDVNNIVHRTNNETIDGVKTFSTSPIVPTPTNATDAANKAYVDTKANLASPAFTGTVTLPSTTSIGTVSSTELSYLDGVTSGIQTQLNGKAATNQTMYVGTTAMAINRATAAQTLTGVSIDGSSASCTGNATTATTATNFVNSSYGTNSISAGTGDGATRTTYNVKFKSWNGTAYADYTDTVNRVLDHRTGIFYSASGSSFLPEYACRAWVNFNGTGTVAIRASGNVSSITDNGEGNYTVNFTTAMPDANYAPLMDTTNTSAGNQFYSFETILNTITASSVRILTTGNSTAGYTALDKVYCRLAVFR